MPIPHPAAVERHPHLAQPLPSGWVRVDLHSHTMWSGDSTTTPDEVEAAVTEAGLDVLCITDHNAIRGATELVGRLPCRVIVGEELRTHAGEIIGLFLVETLNAKTGLRSLNEQAAQFAAEFDLAAGAGSDAHVPLALGSAYVEMPDFDGPADFLCKLRAGRIVGHHWDQHRPWTPRVLPSLPTD